MPTDATASGIRADFTKAIDYGTMCVFRYFNAPSVAGSTYDDNVSAVTASGTDLYESGLHVPVSTKKGSFDSVLLEQGKINHNDSILYFRGTVSTSGLWKVHVGSPVSSSGWFTSMEPGVKAWHISNQQVYKKAYITRLETGSLPQEYPVT